eukprot:TRINITY_DN5338_c0_g1_i2.p1 TRINITY_DN5338_c0_g1~~TRINITY_DN5338_c0_g1_i2.p1  ORF type:complete len:272 (-),score=47.40 TRINITY_DN5338_c0_g1_i2:19-834(-)
MGFKEESLSTPNSTELWQTWKNESCQPNFWDNVLPNPRESCGPYYNPNNGTNIESERVKQISSSKKTSAHVKKYSANKKDVDIEEHRNLAMIVIDSNKNIGAGTSTNGVDFKIAGRIGCDVVIGCGAYVDNDVGAAIQSGDGDILIRFSPTLATVNYMRMGYSPRTSTEKVLERITKKYPSFKGAIIAINKDGKYGANCYGYDSFQYSVMSKEKKSIVVETIKCSQDTTLTTFDKAAIAVGVIFFGIVIAALFIGFYCWNKKKYAYYDDNI